MYAKQSLIDYYSIKLRLYIYINILVADKI